MRTEVHERLGALLGVPAAGTAVVTDAAGVFGALVSRLAPGRGERVWTTPYESAAGLTALCALRDRTRCTVEVVPLREDGDLDLERMARHIGDDVALVPVVHVPCGCAIVNPVEEIGQILALYRCVYAVDASCFRRPAPRGCQPHRLPAADGGAAGGSCAVRTPSGPPSWRPGCVPRSRTPPPTAPCRRTRPSRA
ncbi:aminotransferase class V-fold PLP-dependent enzyme [Streptomyces mirabilis]|uniref:aminotransferase class V-fold PLP-dependent enzyme n=1 Tax=Streptomyces mirabilis TaxID=68239 RepID=UPI00332EE5D9